MKFGVQAGDCLLHRLDKKSNPWVEKVSDAQRGASAARLAGPQSRPRHRGVLQYSAHQGG